MSKFDVVTIGSAVKDVTFYTDKFKVISTPQNLTAQKMLAFEYGAKISATGSFNGFGGGGANSAITFSRLGFKTVSLTAVGQDDTGTAIINNLKKNKVDTNLVQKIPNHNTAISFIISTDKKDKDRTVFTDRGADNYLDLSPKKTASLNSSWVYLTSLSGKNHLKNIAAIFNLTNKKKIKVSWNPGSTQLQVGKRYLAPFLMQTDILIVNKDEAIELALSGIKLGKKNPNHLNRPIYLLNILQEWGPKVVLLTDGKRGAWAYDGKKIYKQNILNRKVVDTTGVGDAFGSAFTAGMIHTKGDIQKSLRWGAINSGSVVTQVGAQNGIVNLKIINQKF